MNTRELQTLLRLLRAQGVAKYSTPELTLELRDHAPRRKRKGAVPDNAPPVSEDGPSEEELLFFSAPSLPTE